MKDEVWLVNKKKKRKTHQGTTVPLYIVNSESCEGAFVYGP